MKILMKQSCIHGTNHQPDDDHEDEPQFVFSEQQRCQYSDAKSEQKRQVPVDGHVRCRLRIERRIRNAGQPEIEGDQDELQPDAGGREQGMDAEQRADFQQGDTERSHEQVARSKTKFVREGPVKVDDQQQQDGLYNHHQFADKTAVAHVIERFQDTEYNAGQQHPDHKEQGSHVERAFQ